MFLLLLFSSLLLQFCDAENWSLSRWKVNATLAQPCLFVTPWTIQSMEFSRPESWSGSLSLLWGIFPTQDLPNLPTLQADSLPAEPQGKGLCQILQLVSDSVGIWTWLLCPESLWFYSTKFHCWSYSTASLKRSLTNSWLISVPLGVLFYFKFWFFFSVFSDVAMVGKTKLSTVV